MTSAPLQIWAVSDGRAGIQNQALGLAEAVARLTPAEITIKHIRWKRGYDRLPTFLKTPRMVDAARSSPLSPPWPDLMIATGRATLPLTLRMKKLSRGRTFVVQTQDPRANLKKFDMVVAPAHDQLEGENVFEIIGSPHRITPERLADSAPQFAERIEPLPHPRIAVMIGGRSKAFDLTPAHAERLASRIARAVKTVNGSLLLTFSRRTPPEAEAVMRAALSDLPSWIWDGEGENPLFGFLHYADHILVTEDSANMAAEAASTGKPVHVLPMIARTDGDKFERLHAHLAVHGATRPFDGSMATWRYDPLAETARAAQGVLDAMAARN